MTGGCCEKHSVRDYQCAACDCVAELRYEERRAAADAGEDAKQFFIKEREQDYARGVADERAQVVADLREWGWRLSKHGRTILLTAAERIEKNRKKAT